MEFSNGENFFQLEAPLKTLQIDFLELLSKSIDLSGKSNKN